MDWISSSVVQFRTVGFSGENITESREAKVYDSVSPVSAMNTTTMTVRSSTITMPHFNMNYLFGAIGVIGGVFILVLIVSMCFTYFRKNDFSSKDLYTVEIRRENNEEAIIDHALGNNDVVKNGSIFELFDIERK